jgi:hypothetical protein
MSSYHQETTMHSDRPIITFRASARTHASREAVYDALADLSTHMTWGGEQTGDKKFRLLTLEQPGGAAVAGTRFSSTGIIPMGTFHDETVVTEALRGDRFALHTASVLERKHGRPTWRGSFDHVYAIDDAGGVTSIRYTCDVHPENYVAWWMKPLMRPMTRFNVQRILTRSLRSLAAIADASEQTVRTRAAAGDAVTG